MLAQILPIVVLATISVGFLYKRGLPANGGVLIVLGSGGHTGEMLNILDRLDLHEDLHFVYGEGDTLSVKRAQKLSAPENFHALPRARKVGQSLFTSVFTSLKTLLAAITLLWRLSPQLLVCNGPGTCVMVVLATRLLFLRTKVVYVESLARVVTLSLTGKLMYHLRLADGFAVQWPELASKYPEAVHTGILV